MGVYMQNNVDASYTPVFIVLLVHNSIKGLLKGHA